MQARKIEKTTVSRRCQTVLPAKIRKRYGIEEGSQLAWVDNGERIEVVPLPRHPIEGLRGAGRGKGLLKALMEYRAEERKK
ncbi:MAG: AbrB/MazE/SpoVT family DNA-binding domain-containing protein [Armatimonadetes bacterium]|nr:AbrB/MazE/SpoVT family DNA-binding domain-containing protein [Armatimonadota bacterium]